MRGTTLPELQRTNPAYRGGYSCDLCRKGSCASLHHCDLCQYDLCMDCAQSVAARSRCQSHHPLLRLTRDDLLAIDRHNVSRVCSMCKVEKTEPFMMVCVYCNTFICPSCYEHRIVCFHLPSYSFVCVCCMCLIFFFSLNRLEVMFVVRTICSLISSLSHLVVTFSLDIFLLVACLLSFVKCLRPINFRLFILASPLIFPHL